MSVLKDRAVRRMLREHTAVVAKAIAEAIEAHAPQCPDGSCDRCFVCARAQQSKEDAGIARSVGRLK